MRCSPWTCYPSVLTCSESGACGRASVPGVAPHSAVPDARRLLTAARGAIVYGKAPVARDRRLPSRLDDLQLVAVVIQPLLHHVAYAEQGHRAVLRPWRRLGSEREAVDAKAQRIA